MKTHAPQGRRIHKVFPGPVPALRGISLEIDKGLFGLLGPNGAGKSTCMNIITGGMMPTSGKVTLCGQDIIKDPSRVRETLGFLPEQFGFYRRMSGRAMLELILSFKGVSSRREQRLHRVRRSRLPEGPEPRWCDRWRRPHRPLEHMGGMRRLPCRLRRQRNRRCRGPQRPSRHPGLRQLSACSTRPRCSAHLLPCSPIGRANGCPLRSS